ncbi:MAG: hypothetical protein OQK95_15260 [Gammaproteobacteria bacterium]|nr:hypothetical protein [Gammaproteobacteria bacterium]
MPSDSTLTLFIPDLFGFESTFSQLSAEEMSSLPETRFPILEKWLSRGLIDKSSGSNDVVFSEFGLSFDSNSEQKKDKPYAALSLLAEKNPEVNIADFYWLRADPVYMQADRDTVLLTAHEELVLTQLEADKLVEKINSHFIDEPWTLYSFGPHRWYLALDKPADLMTYPIAQAKGKNVNHFMATGDDAHYWLTITNEIQMLLHGSNVNFERESRNMLTANSVWLWGGGYLPDINNTNIIHDKVITENILFSGIAQHCGLDVLPLNEKFSNHIQTGNNFIVLDMLSEHIQNSDLYRFMQTLNEIETKFLKCCDELLLSKKINKIVLLADDGTRITATKKYLSRWWKRVKPYVAYKNA